MLCNDATAACAAEFFFGRCWRYRDFLYFFVGEFLGGGLVLDGALRPGRTGNAAALGSMPIMAKVSGDVAPQLIACASIHQLERRLEAAGLDALVDLVRRLNRGANSGRSSTAGLRTPRRLWPTRRSLRSPSIDFEAIVIDGALPATVRERLTARTTQVFASLDRRGLSEVDIVSGSIGADAGSIGGSGVATDQAFRSRSRSFVQGRDEAGELREKRSHRELGSESVCRLVLRRSSPSNFAAGDRHPSQRSNRGVMATRIVKVEPFDLVVFGGAGDLAHRKLYPALFRRERSNQFSEPTRIIGASRRRLDREAFRASVKDSLIKLNVVDGERRRGDGAISVPARLCRGRRYERRGMGGPEGAARRR